MLPLPQKPTLKQRRGAPNSMRCYGIPWLACLGQNTWSQLSTNCRNSWLATGS